MKATGIVRRIDDLGRVVIPKEIRRTLRIREGDPLEIFTNSEGGVILKKYSPICEMTPFAKEFADVVAMMLEHCVIITDRDRIIATAGGAGKEFVNKPISRELEHLINERESLQTGSGGSRTIDLAMDEPFLGESQMIIPIISAGDAMGSIVVFSKDDKVKLGDTEKKVAGMAALFIGRQMEA